MAGMMPSKGELGENQKGLSENVEGAPFPSNPWFLPRAFSFICGSKMKQNSSVFIKLEQQERAVLRGAAPSQGVNSALVVFCVDINSTV